jgi:hypothetical protein
MDSGILGYLVHCMANDVRLTYDIICQWSRHFLHRASLFPDRYARRVADVGLRFSYGIPKFHLPAHGRKCQGVFSLNFRLGWARVDGEGIERLWGWMNRFAPSSREMATGARQDFLDYQFGAWNWQKVVGMGTYRHTTSLYVLYSSVTGKTLAKKLKDSYDGVSVHQEDHQKITQSFEADTITEWTNAVSACQANPTVQDNPFSDPTPGKTNHFRYGRVLMCYMLEYTMADVRAELAVKELEEMSKGAISLHNVSESSFLSIGLEIEQVQ